MGYEAAIGEIEQILQFQQQILDPAASSQGAVGSSSDAASSSDGEASVDFAAALAEAQAGGAEQAVGLTDSGEGDLSDLTGLLAADGGDSLSSLSGSDLLGGGDSQLLSLLAAMEGPGTASDVYLGDTSAVGSEPSIGSDATAESSSDPRIEAMLQEASSLLGRPYVWGGGHDGWGQQQGYDCSGFVSAVLHAGGYLTEPQDTATLPGAAGIESGPGQYVTIYDRNESGEEGHVIIEIDGQFYESGGEHGAWGGGGGVERIATPSAAYLATFNDVLHPAGL